ncbi:MAG: SO_0444 family Cu/Zn efflux transporter [Candidatus Omnitrophota bacterium]|nr:SO_0444 family Cu/Zn efflux transporter [Candidatus Omnitrophota bacterium]
MNILIGILKESYFLMEKMSPYLVFGFLFAGVMHAFMDTKTVAGHLGKNDLLSVLKASVFGIPLPLCSCSVIPSAISLRKDGASKGAVLAFLISTPTTGVDSIFATYSLLGPVFTVYRIAASFLTGSAAGIISNLFKEDGKNAIDVHSDECKFCHNGNEHHHSISEKIRGIFGHAFGTLLRDSGPALIGGVLAGGVITFFLPENIIAEYMGSGIKAMLIMLVMGIPMYVCATASIPIAAALMFKGLAPGAAFVFLVAGPATNIVTMSVVAKTLGKRSLMIYLGSIIAGSLILGGIFDKLYRYFYGSAAAELGHIHAQMLPEWVGFVSTGILCVLIARHIFKKAASRARRQG